MDKHIASLNGKLEKLKRQEHLLEKTQKRMEHAKDWESRQKTEREKNLERTRAELETREGQARTLKAEANRLRDEIQQLQHTLRVLNEENATLDHEERDPSLTAILLHKATRMGSVSQHIFNKTMEHIVPELEYGLHEVLAAQEMLPKDSSAMSLLTSLCIYLLALLVLYMTFTVLRSINKLFTITRILFTVDMAFAMAWFCSAFFFLVLSDDPFGVMSKRHGGLAVIVQVVLLGALVGNVILRCVPLSLQPGKFHLIELFCVLLVTQHYYQSVWRPCMLDENLSTGIGTYFMYMTMSAGLAVYRARSVEGEIEDVQDFHVGGSLGFLKKGSWFRLKFEQTLRYCQSLMRHPQESAAVKFRVEPQYYRKARHPEFSPGKDRPFDGRSAPRYGKKAVAYKR